MKRVLNRWDSVAIITAIVVGVGIFRVPAEIAGFLGSPLLIITAWLIGGMISLMGVLCYAELSSSFPETGGNYVYLRESYGNLTGFLFGWTEFLVIRTGSIAAVAFVSAEYLSSLFSVETIFIKPIAVVIILCLSFFNINGLDRGKRIHNYLTLINISSIVFMIITGVLLRKGSAANFSAVEIAPDMSILPLLGLALIPILWTYGGWHENTFMGEETKDAARTLPRALITGVLLITGIYLAINMFYLYLIPVPEMTGVVLIGSDAFNIIYGVTGRKIFEVIVVLASIGSINAMIITGSRITYAMAGDNRIFAYLGNVGKRFGTPHRAIIINAVWASFLVLFGTFGRLLFFTGILVWLFFALSGASIFILRRKFPFKTRPYRVWGYPAVPVFFIIICGVIFINTLVFNPIPSLAGLGLLLSGVPVYLISKRCENKE